MLMLGTDMVLDMDMAIDMDMVDTTDTDIPTGHTDTTERGLLMLSQQLNQMLKLMLMLGMDITDIAVDTMVDTTDIPTGHTDTSERRRDLLMLSQQLNQMLKLMLMLGTDITAVVLDMDMAIDMDMVDTTAIPTGHTDTTERGLLMLSQRPSLSLQLMLTTSDTVVLAMDTLDMDTDTPSQAHCGVPVPDTTGDRCHAL